MVYTYVFSMKANCVSSSVLKRCAGGSVANGRASQDVQVKKVTHEERYPGRPVTGLNIGLTSQSPPPKKKKSMKTIKLIKN